MRRIDVLIKDKQNIMKEANDNELIHDQEVKNIKEDKLGHRAIAEELLTLCKMVATPATVSLFGPWGSGKTGIANLLKEQLGRERKIKYVRFDAFKYAENPLRRNFISVTSKELGIDQEKIAGDLYRDTKENHIDLSSTQIKKIAKIFSLSSLIILSLILIGQYLAFWLTENKLLNFYVALQQSLLPVLIPSSLLSMLSALIGKNITIEKSKPRIDSDEQFENHLREIVKKSNASRIIFFIDELDRCSPNEVVATLDAVRTFFGIDKCIFIVAADQQVLESALSKSLSQSTPSDQINPYYSSANSYLDKVFQYQLSVPPLLPQSITSYALELINDLGGLWENLNKEVIASILIPSHVQSPRRVKILINSFSMLCHIIEKKNSLGEIDVNIKDRSQEIAKIVCLKTEFPVFFRSLILHPKMPDYITSIIEEGEEKTWEKHPNTSEEIKALSEKYAHHKEKTDILISKDNRKENDKKIIKSQAQQLTSYLLRTRNVGEIKEDLIFLKSVGGLYGIPSETARKIEVAAHNGNIHDAIKAIDELDESEKSGVFDFLINLERASFGIEQSNVLTVALSIFGNSEAPTTQSLDHFINIVIPELKKESLFTNSECLKGAWKLSLSSNSPESSQLAELTLKSASNMVDSELICHILVTVKDKNIEISPISNSLEDLVIGGHQQDVISIIKSMDRHHEEKLIPPLLDFIHSQFEMLDDNSTEGEDENKEEKSGLISLSQKILSTLCEIESPLLEKASISLLDFDIKAARDHFEEAIEEIPFMNTEEFLHSALNNMTRRTISLWPKWLSLCLKINSKLTRSFQPILAARNKLLQYNDNFDESAHTKSAKLLSALASHLSPESVQELSNSEASFFPLKPSELNDQSIKKSLSVLSIGLDNALLSKNSAIECITHFLFDITSQINENSDETLIPSMLEVIRKASSLSFESAENREDIHSIITEINNSEIINERDKIYSTLHLSYLLPEDHRNLLSHDEIINNENINNEIEIFNLWLGLTKEHGEDIFKSIESKVSSNTPAQLLSSVAGWINRIPEEASNHFIEYIVNDPDQVDLNKSTLSSIGYLSIEDNKKYLILMERYNNCTANYQIERVLNLWSNSEITDESIRKKLIDEIFIPFMKRNNTAASIALKKIKPLCFPIPHGMKGQLTQSVINSTKNKKDLKRKARAALLSIGCEAPKKWWQI